MIRVMIITLSLMVCYVDLTAKTNGTTNTQNLVHKKNYRQKSLYHDLVSRQKHMLEIKALSFTQIDSVLQYLLALFPYNSALLARQYLEDAQGALSLAQKYIAQATICYNNAQTQIGLTNYSSALPHLDCAIENFTLAANIYSNIGFYSNLILAGDTYTSIGDAYTDLAFVYVQLSNIPASALASSQAGDAYNLAGDAYDQATALLITNAMPLHKDQPVFDIYQSLFRSNTNISGSSYEQIAQSYVKSGTSYQKSAQYYSSINDVTKAAQTTTSAADGFLKAGIAYEQAATKYNQENNINAAEQAFLKSKQFTTVSATTYLDASLQYNNIHRYDDAATNCFSGASSYIKVANLCHAKSWTTDEAEAYYNAAQAYICSALADHTHNTHPLAGDMYTLSAEAFISATNVWMLMLNINQAHTHYLNAATAYQYAAQEYTHAGQIDQANARYNTMGSTYQQAGLLLKNTAQITSDSITSGNYYNQAGNDYNQASIAYNLASNQAQKAAACFNAAQMYQQAGQKYNDAGNTDEQNSAYQKAIDSYECAGSTYMALGDGQSNSQVSLLSTQSNNSTDSSAYDSYIQAGDAYNQQYLLYLRMNNNQAAYQSSQKSGQACDKATQALETLTLTLQNCLLKTVLYAKIATIYLNQQLYLNATTIHQKTAQSYDCVGQFYSANNDVASAQHAYEQKGWYYIQQALCYQIIADQYRTDNNCLQAAQNYVIQAGIYQQVAGAYQQANNAAQVVTAYQSKASTHITAGQAYECAAASFIHSVIDQAAAYTNAAQQYEQAGNIYNNNFHDTSNTITYYTKAAEMYHTAGLTDLAHNSNQVTLFNSSARLYTTVAQLYTTTTATSKNISAAQSYVQSGNNYNLAAANQADACSRKALYYLARDQYKKAKEQYDIVSDIVNSTLMTASITLAQTNGDLTLCSVFNA